MRLSIAIAVSLAVLLGAVCAQSRSAAGPTPPAFALFQRYCIDTNADARVVAKVAVAAGAKVLSPWRRTDTPVPMAGESWRAPLGSGTADVSTGVVAARRTQNVPPEVGLTCSIQFFEKDSASLQAAKSWAGGPRTTGDYLFHHVGEARAALPPGDKAYLGALEAGDLWLISVVPDQNGGTLQLTRFLKASDLK